MRLFNEYGTVTLAEEQGKPQKTKDVTKKNAKKQICLNCKKKTCSGYCKDFKEKATPERKNKNREENSK